MKRSQRTIAIEREASPKNGGASVFNRGFTNWKSFQLEVGLNHVIKK